ncbi:mandelate racemase, partial [Candidatus Poribacteria bacterium]|nr:mandelate racemase [Candidatus Poribacteria bacterium]
KDLKQLIIQGKVSVVQPDLGRIGGFSVAQEIGLLAQETGSWPVPHAFGTGVLLAASAQWAATRQKPLTEFTRASSPLAQELVLHDITFKDGI